MDETELERSARLLAQHIRAALPHARILFQDSTEAGRDARAYVADAVNSRHEEAWASALFFLDAIANERVRQMTIDKNGPSILERTWPYSPYS